ncbi:uncharacterized protein RCC_09766 [Ramularia collo-cygni]|uniref:Uncharacterized protein n=1 Tax=Ramularia collo-cygni TaxID=112498 RepID=A0A2D3VKQ4_9PEZI|nr:uncharacterized protein RCC_09766 [Ramularia collo-cygni]CZT24049.1 uncharacterized protein RCC_09766 [Ramularia collo-cygni]
MERVERRGSIARAFSRIRLAMKRRRPTDTRTICSDKPIEAITQVHVLPVSPQNADIPFRPSTTQPNATSPPTLLPDPFSKTLRQSRFDEQLEVDTDDYTDEDEPFPPVSSFRPGISDSKASALFRRYGLSYSEHISQAGPPRKLRRIERPILMKVHWTCHSCKTQFGIERTCVKCGHPKCAQCLTHPRRRVGGVLENGRYLIEETELPQQDPISSGDESIERSANNSPVRSALPSPLVERVPSIDGNGEIGESTLHSPLYTRPNAAIPIFERDDRSNRFMLHPRQSKAHTCSQVTNRLCMISNGENPVMRAVQRVYRKPRQRVRYTCEHCGTLLVEGDRCSECDHNRFLRSPPRRMPTQYDADILQIVTNRLAAHDGGFQQGLTA